MLVLLPIVFWLLLFFVFARFIAGSKGFYTIMREAYVWATLIWGVTTVSILEILSIFRAITQINLALCWGIMVLSAGLIVIRVGIGRLYYRLPKLQLDFIEKFMVLCILFILIITATIALIAPPNNYDAMSYHMARVAHWAQNHSVAHYPTHILRQLYMPPGAEFIILNFQVLLGNDYLANLVQWFSMVGSIIVITLIAKILGANYKVQILSAFIGATVPTGIMQSTSVQTDYMVTFWVLCLAFFAIQFNGGKSYLLNTAGASLALGLALLTKPTAYFFAAPFVFWLIIKLFVRVRFNVWKPLLIMLITVILLNAGFFARNYGLFCSPLGPHDSNIVNESFSIKNLTVNILKYFSMNVNTPFESVNNIIYGAVINCSNVLGAHLNDRSTSAYENFSVSPYAPHEDLVGNPVHLALIFLCGLLLFQKIVRREHPLLPYYFSCVVAGFLLFLIFIKYQPWLNRLMLPEFLLFTPFIGIVLSRTMGKKLLAAIFIVLLIVAIPPLLFNVKKPVVPPPSLFVPPQYRYSLLTQPRQFFYFAAKPETYKCYKKIAETIKKRNYSQIGLEDFSSSGNEYPLWIMLAASGRKFRLEHVGVPNLSGKIYLDFKPSALIGFDPTEAKEHIYKTNYEYREFIGKDSRGLRIILYGN